MKKLFVLIVLLLILGGSYWYSIPRAGDQDLSSQDPNQSDAQTVGQFSIKTFGGIGIAKNGNNSYLVDQNGFTLYFNSQDETRTQNAKPACNAECEKTWIPYLYDGVSGGLSQSNDPFLSKFNFYNRADGKKQYALGNHPLYHYVFDQQVGEAKGVGTANWIVATP